MSAAPEVPLDIRNVMHDCVLAIFWPKKQIVEFLVSVDCLVNFLIARWEASPATDENFRALLSFAREWRDWQAAALDPDAVATRLSKLRLMSDDVYIYDLKMVD